MYRVTFSGVTTETRDEIHQPARLIFIHHLLPDWQMPDRVNKKEWWWWWWWWWVVVRYGLVYRTSPM